MTKSNLAKKDYKSPTWQVSTKSIMAYDEFPEYDIIWTDPPWQDRMQKFFHTQLKKDTGAIVTDSHEEVINQLARLAAKNRPVFLAYGVKGHRLVKNIMVKHGHTYNWMAIVPQSNNRPHVIMTFNSGHYVTSDGFKKGFDFVTETVEYFRKLDPDGDPIRVFDPFAGIGKTCEAVLKGGGSYIGSELNPKRVEKFRSYMKKKGL